jgi:hypothetical protein
MLIFKENATYRWDGNAIDTEPLIDVGTTSHDSIQTVHGITFFANRKGVYAYTKGQPKLISRKVRKWWDAITETKYATLVAGVDEDHYCVAIGDVTVDGIAYSNVELVYNIPLNAWTVNALPSSLTAIIHYATVKDVDGEKYLVNAVNANEGVIIRNIGVSDQTDAVGGSYQTNPISSVIRTKEYLVNFPKKAFVDKAYVSMQQAVNSSISYRMDRKEDFIPMGRNTDRITEHQLKSEGSTIQFQISDNSINQPIVEGLAVYYEPKK